MASFPQVLADRYRRYHQQHFVPNAAAYAELAKGQAPETMIISCSDSRVEPESIFNAAAGELFVVRNVANLVPPDRGDGGDAGVLSAVEFAVLNLRIKNLVVMGHSGCGGIKVSFDRNAAVQTRAQSITRWVSMLDATRDSVLAATKSATQAVRQTLLEGEGVRTSIENLRSALRHRLRRPDGARHLAQRVRRRVNSAAGCVGYFAAAAFARSMAGTSLAARLSLLIGPTCL